MHHYIRFFVFTAYGIDVNDVWFQQDGATYHTPHATNELLCQTLDDRLITSNFDILILLFFGCIIDIQNKFKKKRQNAASMQVDKQLNAFLSSF